MGERAVDIPIGGSSNSTVHARVIVSSNRSPVAVICLHPWGVMGGSLHDPHPATVCQIMAEAGCSTARLNFRSGIGSPPAPPPAFCSLPVALP